MFDAYRNKNLNSTEKNLDVKITRTDSSDSDEFYDAMEYVLELGTPFCNFVLMFSYLYTKKQADLKNIIYTFKHHHQAHKPNKLTDSTDSNADLYEDDNKNETVSSIGFNAQATFATEVTQDMSSEFYKMDHNHRGVVIIFNHYSFDDSNYGTRNGTDADVNALQRCLPKLGFLTQHIFVERDLTKMEIMGYIYKINATHAEVLANADCIAIIILSHGEKGNQIMARDGPYDLYQFITQFTPKISPNLAAKPKLFFVNACRGSLADDGIVLKSRMRAASIDQTDSIREEIQVTVHPVFADLLISLSSHVGHVSFRNDLGTWYIQCLCEAIDYFEERIDATEISEILLKMHYLVATRKSEGDDSVSNNKKQIPNYISSLCRKLYFTRKLQTNS